VSKCEHGLTSAECYVCASPKYGKHAGDLVVSAADGKQVPLHELLRTVPKDARLTIDDGPYSTHYIPVGRYCHEAVDDIERLQAEVAHQTNMVDQANVACMCLEDEIERLRAEVEALHEQARVQDELLREWEEEWREPRERAEKAEEKIKACKIALDFAAGAIGDAIYTEDGLDGDTGQRVLHIIAEAREEGTFDLAEYGSLDRLCPFSRAEKAEADFELLRKLLLELSQLEADGKHADECSIGVWERVRVAAIATKVGK
jgi:hypothetical protein